MGNRRGVSVPARAPHLSSRAVGDECVVVDAHDQRAHALSGALAQVWRESDGDVRDADFLSDDDRAEAVAGLQALGLLLTDGLDRRSLLRRAGVVGGVAVVGAGVTSIAMPDAAAAASSGPVSQSAAGPFSFTVPAGANITRVEFTLNGAGGGGRPAGSNPGQNPGSTAGRGGSGARITGTVTRPLASGGLGGVVISGYVGEGGKTSGGGGAGSVGPARGGGAGGSSISGGIARPAAAGGGGASTMVVDGATVVIAGAGGGAATAYFSNYTAVGGAAGAIGGSISSPNFPSSGVGGGPGSGATGGAGGTNPAHGGEGASGAGDADGGSGGTGGAGIPGNAVNSAGGGGGGGGGYGGGGGGEGSADNGVGGGGGGGSSLTAAGSFAGSDGNGSITVVVNTPTTPNSGSGAGGLATADGTDGSISLTYRTFV